MKDESQKKVLVIKLSSLGDLFHALPAVHCVKVGLGAEIHWVVQSEYVELVKCFTDVSRVIPFSRREFFKTLDPFLPELWQNEYDVILDFQGLMKSAVVARLAKGRNRIGPSFHREGTDLIYDSIAGKRDKNRHAVEECMDVVRHLGLKELPPEFPVAFPRRELQQKRPRVAMLPSSRWPTKNWPAECFIEAGRRLAAARAVSLFVLGGAKDGALCARIAGALGDKAVNLAGQCSLAETGGVLQEMDLLIANDTGPVHMAAAVGVPSLVVFGPTDPGRTGPFGPRHRVAKASLPCQPCFSRKCRKGDVPCMTAVTPERVSDLALEML